MKKIRPYLAGILEDYQDQIVEAGANELEEVKAKIVEEAQYKLSAILPKNPLTKIALNTLLPKAVDKMVEKMLEKAVESVKNQLEEPESEEDEPFDEGSASQDAISTQFSGRQETRFPLNPNPQPPTIDFSSRENFDGTSIPNLPMSNISHETLYFALNEPHTMYLPSMKWFQKMHSTNVYLYPNHLFIEGLNTQRHSVQYKIGLSHLHSTDIYPQKSTRYCIWLGLLPFIYGVFWFGIFLSIVFPYDPYHHLYFETVLSYAIIPLIMIFFSLFLYYKSHPALIVLNFFVHTPMTLQRIRFEIKSQSVELLQDLQAFSSFIWQENSSSSKFLQRPITAISSPLTIQTHISTKNPDRVPNSNHFFVSPKKWQRSRSVPDPDFDSSSVPPKKWQRSRSVPDLVSDPSTVPSKKWQRSRSVPDLVSDPSTVPYKKWQRRDPSKSLNSYNEVDHLNHDSIPNPPISSMAQKIIIPRPDPVIKKENSPTPTSSSYSPRNTHDTLLSEPNRPLFTDTYKPNSSFSQDVSERRECRICSSPITAEQNGICESCRGEYLKPQDAL